MPFFTEQMHTLSTGILNSRNAREATVTRLKYATAQILADGRALVKQLGDQTLAMAVECREKLMSDRQALSKQVQALRKHNRKEQHHASDQLRKTLAESCASRQKEVRELLHGFAKFQKALAADLQGAACAWHGTQRRQPAGTGAHGHHVGKEGHKETTHKKTHGS